MTLVLRRRHAYDASIKEVGRVTVMAPPKSCLVAVVDMLLCANQLREYWLRSLANGKTVSRPCATTGVTADHVHVTDAFNIALPLLVGRPRRLPAPLTVRSPSPSNQSHDWVTWQNLEIMFDSARRSTMQPAADLNARSHLPVPSTIKKPTHTGRMSIAGPALRGPYPMPGQIPGTNPRASMMRSQNVNPLLQSASKPNFGRTPLHR